MLGACKCAACICLLALNEAAQVGRVAGDELMIVVGRRRRKESGRSPAVAAALNRTSRPNSVRIVRTTPRLTTQRSKIPTTRVRRPLLCQRKTCHPRLRACAAALIGGACFLPRWAPIPLVLSRARFFWLLDYTSRFLSTGVLSITGREWCKTQRPKSVGFCCTTRRDAPVPGQSYQYNFIDIYQVIVATR